MKRKKLNVGALLLGLALSAQAQQATVASGGNASGSGGSVAYSVGQVVFTTNTTASGSVAQGVQQPYEISIVLDIDDHQLSIDLNAYPNPTAGYLILQVGDGDHSNLKFHLFDMHGRLIENREISNPTETIRMDHLPGAAYFLRVTNDNRELKTFKIIKY